MARRKSTLTGNDYYPTPPIATEKLLKVLYEAKHEIHLMSCLEPAAGGGHMSDVLGQHFANVKSSDIQDPENRGWGGRDFLLDHYEPESFDWVITNPPFKLADEFVLKAISVAKVGVAMLCRLQFLEGWKRYEKLFSAIPPSKVCVFIRRVNMTENRLVGKGDPSSATCYAWFVWHKNTQGYETKLFWI